MDFQYQLSRCFYPYWKVVVTENELVPKMKMGTDDWNVSVGIFRVGTNDYD